jgi:hypothetical protein
LESTAFSTYSTFRADAGRRSRTRRAALACLLLLACRGPLRTSGESAANACAANEQQRPEREEDKDGTWRTSSYEVTLDGATPNLLADSGYLTSRVTDEGGTPRAQGRYLYVKNFSPLHAAYLTLGSAPAVEVGPGETRLVAIAAGQSKNERGRVSVGVSIRFYVTAAAARASASRAPRASSDAANASRASETINEAARAATPLTESGERFMSGLKQLVMRADSAAAMAEIEKKPAAPAAGQSSGARPYAFGGTWTDQYVRDFDDSTTLQRIRFEDGKMVVALLSETNPELGMVVYTVAISDINPKGIELTATAAPDRWLVVVNALGNRVTKVSRTYGGPVLDDIPKLPLFFANRASAEEASAALRSLFVK